MSLVYVFRIVETHGKGYLCIQLNPLSVKKNIFFNIIKFSSKYSIRRGYASAVKVPGCELHRLESSYTDRKFAQL